MNGLETQQPPPKQGCETPPKLAMEGDHRPMACCECGTVVVLNYTKYLGRVYCPRCALAEAHE